VDVNIRVKTLPAHLSVLVRRVISSLATSDTVDVRNIIQLYSAKIENSIAVIKNSLHKTKENKHTDKQQQLEYKYIPRN